MVMIVQDCISILEKFAPLQYQESYDNAGLLVGNRNETITKALLTLDVTPAVVLEAIDCGANIIIAHHPIIFKPLSHLTDSSDVEICVQMAIKHSIAIYACHTNLDAMIHGVNAKICEKIGLLNTQIMVPRQNQLTKLATFVPNAYVEKVQDAIFAAGAGCIGNYDKCSFVAQGDGTFRSNEQAHPFVGEKNTLHHEPETRIETIFPNEKTNEVLSALFATHPYEEVAYDLYPIRNNYPLVGDGMIGELAQPMETMEFLAFIKETFHSGAIKYTASNKKTISKVAVCGGSGSFLIKNALQQKADIFISADMKYHDFFLANNSLILADIGHYESEQYTKELFYELLNKNFYNFAIQISKVNTNPINYL